MPRERKHSALLSISSFSEPMRRPASSTIVEQALTHIQPQLARTLPSDLQSLAPHRSRGPTRESACLPTWEGCRDPPLPNLPLRPAAPSDVLVASDG